MPQESTSSFLRALWEAQERDGLNARELADKLGIAEATVSRYRSGDREPSGDVTRAILRVYPHLIDYLSPTSDGEEAGTVPVSRRV